MWAQRMVSVRLGKTPYSLVGNGGQNDRGVYWLLISGLESGGSRDGE